MTIETATASDEAIRTAFLSAMRQLAAAVTIITSATPAGRSGLTATAVCSATADPPSLLVCVNKTALTHPVILESGGFCVNLLRPDQTETANVFAGLTGLEGEARFLASGDWHADPAGLPVLAGSLAAISCAVRQQMDIGTHTVFVGRVVACKTADGADALLYANRSYGAMRPI